MKKIIKRAELIRLVKHLRKEGYSIVFTNGCFDILHVGHIRVLEEASKLGDVLIVGLNSDSSVERLKGKNRPVQHEDDRAAILAAISYVSYVIIFNNDTPLSLIKLIEPDFLVKGGDYKDKAVVGAEFAKKVVIAKMVKNRSTTKLLAQKAER